MLPVSRADTPKDWAERSLALAALVLLVFVLFYQLGGAALFEPDEGRNAEKAREILLTQDWVTLRQDFLPVLDKPMALCCCASMVRQLLPKERIAIVGSPAQTLGAFPSSGAVVGQAANTSFSGVA